MLCCGRQDEEEPGELPPIAPVALVEAVEGVEGVEAREGEFFERCEVHDREIGFICKSEECRDRSDSMLCSECLCLHRDHDWITRQDFLTPNIRSILTFRATEADQILQDTLGRLKERVQAVAEGVAGRFGRIGEQLERSVLNVEEKYRFRVEGAMGSSRVLLDRIKLEKLLNIYEIEQSKFQWVRAMEQGLLAITAQVADSLANLLQDLLNVADAEKWEAKDSHLDELREFERHLHRHSTDDARYHRFSALDRHMNIRLSRAQDQATYLRAVPSRPVALGAEYISHTHSRFGIEVLKMSSKAIFFDSTVVLVGICNASLVKSCGFRRVNEFGKGAYLISSQGWAYHSADEAFNDREIVGWGFGQGDRIEVEVRFDAECLIRFTKRGRFFENTFEMPLKLNEFQMKRLKPCVGFDSEQGAIVRIFDIEEPQPNSDSSA